MSETRKNYFFWNKATFEKAARMFVCPVCRFADERDDCRIPDPRGCAVLRYLPQLVLLAQQLPWPDAKAYARLIQENIPMKCGFKGPGVCHWHDTLDCDLRGLLPFVLEAVWRADSELEERVGFDERELSSETIPGAGVTRREVGHDPKNGYGNLGGRFGGAVELGGRNDTVEGF